MPRADQLFIPSSYSRIVARELGLQEKELPRLLEGTGLTGDILLPGDETRLTAAQQLRVLQNACRIRDIPEFGLRLGRQLQPSAHGPVGYLVLTSPDLLSALQALRDYLPTRIPFAQLTLTTDAQWLHCSLAFRLRAQPAEKRVLLECFALVIQAVAEAVLGRALTEARICLTYSAPDYARVYPDYLNSPITFSAPGNTVSLPLSTVQASNAAGDREAHALAKALCLKLMQQTPASHLSTRDRVRLLLLSKPAGSITEADVAQALFVSKRTLARRLEREGSAYHKVRDALLAELAARHLNESGLSVEAVAALLGYHDSANFRRAFKRWYGVTPSAYRTAFHNKAAATAG